MVEASLRLGMAQDSFAALVYADWLEENGKSESDFIRQICTEGESGFSDGYGDGDGDGYGCGNG